MSKLILIRGLPGSGKSTMARKMVNSIVPVADFHFEADMWLCLHSAYDGNEFIGFEPRSCDYRWTPMRAKAAHKACIEATTRTLRGGFSVVVSNTFTQAWEIQPYLDAAREFGASVEIITATGNYGSIHNVPKEAIAAMQARFEEVTV